MRNHRHLAIGPLAEPGGFEIGEDALARLEPFETAIGFGHRIGQMRVAIEDVDQFEAVPPPNFEIIEVMRGRDLDGAAAHLRIGIIVGDDRKSTRLNSSHRCISYAVFCLKKKKKEY